MIVYNIVSLTVFSNLKVQGETTLENVIRMAATFGRNLGGEVAIFQSTTVEPTEKLLGFVQTDGTFEALTEE
jgi:hypothetical protein